MVTITRKTRRAIRAFWVIWPPHVSLTSEKLIAFGVAVLLKGAETVVAAVDGTLIDVPPATHWLATAGSGDVLAGILGALVATHAGEVHADPARLAELAASAAVVHGLAAERASGGGPIAALDVAEAVPATIAALLAR